MLSGVQVPTCISTSYEVLSGNCLHPEDSANADAACSTFGLLYKHAANQSGCSWVSYGHVSSTTTTARFPKM